MIMQCLAYFLSMGQPFLLCCGVSLNSLSGVPPTAPRVPYRMLQIIACSLLHVSNQSWAHAGLKLHG